MTKALVLGGAGFIGTAACKELMRRGIETVAAGRKERPYGTFTSYVAFDRADESQLEHALDSVQPDVVLDLACYQPEQVRAIVAKCKAQRYVFISSGSIYPDLNGRPASEDDFQPLAGDAPADLSYADGKRWCETLLSRAGEFPWTVVRPPAVFGASDRTLRIAAYIERVADGGPVLLPAETFEQQAGLAWVKDVGYACALACDPRKQVRHRAYNIGFEGVSVKRLVEGIARAMNMPANIHPVPFESLPDGTSPYGPRPNRSAGYLIDRARAELGFVPSALEDALAETLAWYRVEHPSHPGYRHRQEELALVS